GLVGESITGQRRTYYVEGISSTATVSGRIGKRFDHFLKLYDRAGPSVRDYQRCRVGVRRPGMDEVYFQTVNLGLELWESIKQRLARAPVVLLQPVRGDLLGIYQR